MSRTVRNDEFKNWHKREDLRKDHRLNRRKAGKANRLAIVEARQYA